MELVKMRSWGGPNIPLLCPFKKGRGHRTPEQRWIEASTGQGPGMVSNTRSWRRQEGSSSQTEGANTLILDFDRRTQRMSFPVFSHTVCGELLQPPQDTHSSGWD